RPAGAGRGDDLARLVEDLDRRDVEADRLAIGTESDAAVNLRVRLEGRRADPPAPRLQSVAAEDGVEFLDAARGHGDRLASERGRPGDAVVVVRPRRRGRAGGSDRHDGG